MFLVCTVVAPNGSLGSKDFAPIYTALHHQKAKRICARANVIRYTNTSVQEKATCSRNRNMQCSWLRQASYNNKKKRRPRRTTSFWVSLRCKLLLRRSSSSSISSLPRSCELLNWHSAPFPTHTQLTSTHNFGPGLVRCEIILSLQLFHQAVIKCSTNPSGQATSGWPLI